MSDPAMKQDDALAALKVASAELALAEEVCRSASQVKGALSVLLLLKLKVDVLREEKQRRLQAYLAALSELRDVKPGSAEDAGASS